jgi:hypothetical protein
MKSRGCRASDTVKHMKPIPHPLGYLLLGLLFVVGPFFWNVDAGDRTLSAAEAWARGLAHITMAMGAALVVLATLLWRGLQWPRWLILCWCPVTILMVTSWPILKGTEKFMPTDFWAIGVPLMLFWIWMTWRHLFGNAR